MPKSARGFTIVELLIVIVVIGILAAISVTAFNGVQTRALNTARHNELKSWHKIFELYRISYGSYPAVADGGHCLGSGFPIGYGGVARCRDFGSDTNNYPESGNTALMNELKKVSSLPGGPRTPPRGSGTVGPYIISDQWDIYLYGTFQGTSAADCPSGTNLAWTDNTRLALCSISLKK